MLHRYKARILGSALVLALIIMPFSGLNQSQAVVSQDNGSVHGTFYKYSGSGVSDFIYYFYNNGFSTSNNNPEQIVLTASSGTGVSYQVSVWIYNNNNVIGDDEAWAIPTTGNPLFQNQFSLSGIPNSWHTIELKMINSGGNYYVGYYVDGVWHNSYSSTSTFDVEQVPNAVVESNDLTSTDWTNVQVNGYLKATGTSEPTFFYGGTWGAANAGCTIGYQTSSQYIGNNVQGPSNVGTTGNILSNIGVAREFYIGNISHYFTINDQIEQDDYTSFTGNACQVSIS